MTNFIVLGLIPGTQFQLTLLGVLFIIFGISLTLLIILLRAEIFRFNRKISAVQPKEGGDLLA